MDALTSPDRTRREGVDSVPITLADGQRWGLALPSHRLRPEVVEGVDPLGRPEKSIRLVSEYGYPLEIRRLIDELRSACDRGAAERQCEGLVRLAVALIRRAHDVDLASVTALLELDAGEWPGVVDAVLAAVAGPRPFETASTRGGEADG